MRRLLTTLKLAVLITTVALTCRGAQPPSPKPPKSSDADYVATVRIVAFGASGGFLGVPDIRVFEGEDRKNQSAAFHAGVAERIPFGTYRIEVSMAGFYPETRYVAVYAQKITVVVGLILGHESLTLPVPPRLHGVIVGAVPSDKKTFVKLLGILAEHSLESEIGSNGQFDFGVPWNGRYVLLVVDEDAKVLATHLVDVPYLGTPLEISVRNPAER